ncbi:MAG: hypothetical protein U0X91_15225 [Spirosomataceae bacterium]
MKTKALSLLGLMVLGWGCNPKDPVEAVAEGNFISSVSETTKANGEEVTDLRNYLYDERMRLKEINYARRSGTASTLNQFSVENKQVFSYSNNDLLTIKTETEVIDERAGDQKSKTQKQITTNYNYLNGLLTEEMMQQVTVKSNSSVTKTLKTTYDYDANAKLRKKTTVDETGTQRVWVFENGLLTDYVERAANGAETHPFLIKNGLIEKVVYTDGNFGVYEYDAELHLTKFTLYVSAEGKINHYYTMGWSTGKSHELALPAFKGHPILPDFNGKKGILTHFDFYAEVNGKLVQLNDSNYKNEFYEDGFVKNTVLENNQFGTAPTDPVSVATVSTVYRYLGK